MRTTILTIVCALLMTATASATDLAVFTLDSPGGLILGDPGTTIGWGFSLTWTSTDLYWISVTGSSFDAQSNASIGLGGNGYTDFMGAQGGPFDFALQPSGVPWTQTFSLVFLQGAGSFAIDPGAAYLALNQGTLTLNFDVYDGDPFLGANYITSGSVSAAASVQVNPAPLPSEVPEPGILVLLCTGFAAIGLRAAGARLIGKRA